MRGLLAAAVLFTVSCSLVVEPGEERCSANAGCPSDMVCFEGLCQVGTCVEGDDEICNGVDDDCDGIIDEEQGIEVCNGLDDDCDGEMDEGLGAASEVCNGLDDDCDGTADEDVPTMTDICNMVDDDCDGVMDEGTTEICNNVDDDCDGMTDEALNVDGVLIPLCDAALVCAGECVPRSCANDELLACDEEVDYCNTSLSPAQCQTIPPRNCNNDSECGANELCIDDIGVCRAITPLGTECRSDDTCVDGTFCADLEAVGRPGVTTCTNTCCNDSDCPGQSHCVSTHLGARLCVPTDQGGVAVGGTCEAHVDCASGYCRIAQGICEAMCSSDANCGSSDACVLWLVETDSTAITSGCFNEGDRREAHETCTESAQCRNALCFDGECREPCGATGECPTGDGCTSFPWSENQSLNICLPENPDGPAGRSCTVNGQCDSLRCHNGTCVAPCCSDDTCSSGRVCRPIQTGDFWPTFCVPPN